MVEPYDLVVSDHAINHDMFILAGDKVLGHSFAKEGLVEPSLLSQWNRYLSYGTEDDISKWFFLRFALFYVPTVARKVRWVASIGVCGDGDSVGACGHTVVVHWEQWAWECQPKVLCKRLLFFFIPLFLRS